VAADQDLNAQLKEIYEIEGPKLYGYLIKKAGPDLAQDIMQETFARLHTRLMRATDVKNTRAYLFQIARHLLYHETAFASRFTSADTALENYAATETNDPEERELLQTLSDVVGSLDDREKEIFDLRWNRGLTQVEIASTLGKSERQIRRDLEKLTVRLRQLFKDHGWNDTPEMLRA
jgi:RNA polymerase sigma-70 factor, ECF subfamily